MRILRIKDFKIEEEFQKIEIWDQILFRNFSNYIPSRELTIIYKLPKTVSVKYYMSDTKLVENYITIVNVKNKECITLEFNLLNETKNLTKGTIEIKDYYKIDYCLPEKFLNFLMVFFELKSIFEEFEKLYSNKAKLYVNLVENIYEDFTGDFLSTLRIKIAKSYSGKDAEKLIQFSKKCLNNSLRMFQVNLYVNESILFFEKNNSNSQFELSDKIEKILKTIKILKDSKFSGSLFIENSATVITPRNSNSIKINSEYFLKNIVEKNEPSVIKNIINLIRL